MVDCHIASAPLAKHDPHPRTGLAGTLAGEAARFSCVIEIILISRLPMRFKEAKHQNLERVTRGVIALPERTLRRSLLRVAI